MQRQREADRLLHLVDEAPEAGQPADCRDRRPAIRDADVGEPPRRREHGVEVEHRLAHPHEDAVVDGLEPAEVERLVDDLRRREVAPEAHLPGRAERARERAAGLRGDADRAPSVAVAHEHGLDRMAVGGAEERLHRAVRCLRLALDRERRERHLVGERLPEAGGQVGHRVVAGRAPRRPVPDLAGPVRRLTALEQHAIEVREVHADTVAPGGDAYASRILGSTQA